MKIAVLSDTRLPTSPNYPGHGLGQLAYTLASGLAQRGYEVTLFAGNGSEFSDGKLITEQDERHFVRHDLTIYHALLDITHGKVTRLIQNLPVVQSSQDRESTPSAQAVFPTKAHRAWHGFSETSGRVVFNGIPTPPAMNTPVDGYFAYLSHFHTAKGALGAMEAARLAGVKLVMAGTTPPAPPPGSEYIGPLSTEDKFKFFAGAHALIYPSAIEAGALTLLEAQAVGCPVICSSYGGAKENMVDGLTGYAVPDTLAMVGAIQHIDKIDRNTCKQWFTENRSAEKMVTEYEALLQAVANGERW